MRQKYMPRWSANIWKRKPGKPAVSSSINWHELFLFHYRQYEESLYSLKLPHQDISHTCRFVGDIGSNKVQKLLQAKRALQIAEAFLCSSGLSITIYSESNP
ncbi:predicted protein [Sclerotinia sclerotiorum 1980 UF-70]|uniref:Uncharacterized protein n=1 Tax=Sclerotinia sclerotiorum (strain ATCC 18683 / 1980 / Ss-1) TaxID=665079 RepID=A7EGC3_SCLS1|nr:predicted protein [Sclerotinia sclerotiorum 1980 UF-70]EDO01889.1 predicted protein [Sclerotinia sclerotiorum 1980 UF-70]